MPASAVTDALRDLWGPGLVFVALCGWLVRRALRAARNESILEEQRLREAVKGMSREQIVALPVAGKWSTL